MSISQFRCHLYAIARIAGDVPGNTTPIGE